MTIGRSTVAVLYKGTHDHFTFSKEPKCVAGIMRKKMRTHIKLSYSQHQVRNNVLGIQYEIEFPKEFCKEFHKPLRSPPEISVR